MGNTAFPGDHESYEEGHREADSHSRLEFLKEISRCMEVFEFAHSSAAYFVLTTRDSSGRQEANCFGLVHDDNRLDMITGLASAINTIRNLIEDEEEFGECQQILLNLLSTGEFQG